MRLLANTALKVPQIHATSTKWCPKMGLGSLVLHQIAQYKSVFRTAVVKAVGAVFFAVLEISKAW